MVPLTLANTAPKHKSATVFTTPRLPASAAVNGKTLPGTVKIDEHFFQVESTGIGTDISFEAPLDSGKVLVEDEDMVATVVVLVISNGSVYPDSVMVPGVVEPTTDTKMNLARGTRYHWKSIALLYKPRSGGAWTLPVAPREYEEAPRVVLVKPIGCKAVPNDTEPVESLEISAAVVGGPEPGCGVETASLHPLNTWPTVTLVTFLFGMVGVVCIGSRHNNGTVHLLVHHGTNQWRGAVQSLGILFSTELLRV